MLLLYCLVGLAAGAQPKAQPPMLVVAIRTLFETREMSVIGYILAFVVWVIGIIYCERVADEQDFNPWLARLAGTLLPVLGPFIYWLLRREARRHRHYKRRPRII